MAGQCRLAKVFGDGFGYWCAGVLLGLALLTVTTPTHAANDNTQILTLDWVDLIPKNERDKPPTPSKAPINHDGDTPPQNMAGGYRDDLDGRQIRLPGFVIPLEGDSETVTELLLVPYFGACIHVPPPPPNQIVYVKFKQGVPIKGLWDVVYVKGKLNVEKVASDLGQAGYLIEGVGVEAYSD